MTPYIQQQLKKLCDNPNWYDDMLISWGKNPRNQREAIYNYLSHVQLNGLLENTQIVFTFINPYLRYPNQEINNNHLHSEHIRLQIREMLQIPLTDITIIDIISLP